MSTRRPHIRSAAAALFLAASAGLWLVPFFKAGWKGRAYRWMPAAVSFQYNAAGLFTRRSTVWWDHHIELQLADGSRVAFDERRAFPMGAFGYRTRFDRILNESSRSPLAPQIRQRLADHIAGRVLADANALKGGAKPRALRLVRSRWRVGSPEMARPPGRWDPPPVHELAVENRHRLATYSLTGGRAVEVPSALGLPERTAAPPGGQVRRRVTVFEKGTPPAPAKHPGLLAPERD